MTYGMIYREFCEKVHIDVSVEDWRPCIELYGVPNIPYAIVIGLEDESKIIYISENARKNDIAKED